MAKLNKAYVELLQQGPFPGMIDPWAETGRYFKQIHGNLITYLLEQIQDPLLERGYIASVEVSMQICEPDLDAIHIRDQEEGVLIAVVEIVSPSNKVDFVEIDQYRERRARLMRQEVNVVEIDATRSVKRLVSDPVVNSWTYHTAIFLPEREAWLVGSDYGQALKRIALPLREDVVPVEPQAAYDRAYQQAAIGGQMLNENRYNEADLPFPSLLTSAQRAQALEQVAAWKAQLSLLSEGAR